MGISYENKQMLDFIFLSTGPELQITLKITRKFHAFPKITCSFFLIAFSLLLLKNNKTPLSTILNIKTWQENMRLVGTSQCCMLSIKL